MPKLTQADDPTSPLEFPATWASEWGEDEKGLWMAFTYKGVRHAFRWIVPGTFVMGDDNGHDDEKPAHQVTISEGFWLGETVVTQALWQAVMGECPSGFKGNDRPVETVSWDDVQDFIHTFNQIYTNLHLCLPSEAQWEYACRAGTQTPYFFGDDITHEQAHFSKDEWGDAKETVDVKAKPANAWGLYQMHGNVWEWCEDRFDENYYGRSSEADPCGPQEPKFNRRVLRGGTWVHSNAGFLRSAYRFNTEPDDRYSHIGFRLARG